MLRKIITKNNQKLKELLKKDIYQNIYLYIDSLEEGFYGKHIKTFYIDNVILYHYYNSLQIFYYGNINNINLDEIINHILKYEFNMITGKKELMGLIKDKLKDFYTISYGIIMNNLNSKHNNTDSNSNEVIMANDDDIKEITKIICSNENIGSNYTYDNLYNQLMDRRKKGCRNLIIKKNDIIVSHAATYAETKDIAVIGGVISNPDYRGLGYGKLVVNELVKILNDEHKVPILYCYDETIKKWYERMGWKTISYCAKLEKINK